MSKSTSFALPVIILIAIAGVIVWPRLYRKREGVKTPPSCSSNVRQMAVALLQYQSMWDDKLPTSNWQTAITPFFRSKVLFTCSQLQLQGRHDGLAMYWHLARREPANSQGSFQYRARFRDGCPCPECRCEAGRDFLLSAHGLPGPPYVVVRLRRWPRQVQV